MPTPIHLTTGSDTTNQTTPYATASITPGANRLVLAAVLVSVGSGDTPTPSLSGCGLTWVLAGQTVVAARTLYLYRAMGSAPTAGAVSIAGDGVLTMTSCLWSITEWSDADTSGTNGSGAIVQTVNAKPGAATSCSVPFATAITAGNATSAAVAIIAQETLTAGAGWTAMGQTAQSAPTTSLLGEAAATGQQNITASWTSSVTQFIVGAEIKAAPAGGNLNRLRVGDSLVNAIRVGDSAVTKVYVGDTQTWP